MVDKVNHSPHVGIMSLLRLIPLDDSVVFPNMTVTLAVDVGQDTRVMLIPRRGGRYARVGVVAEVNERVSLPGRNMAAVLHGRQRGIAGAAQADAAGVLRVEVEPHHDQDPPPEKIAELQREYRAVVEEILDLRGDDGRISSFVRSIQRPGELADTSGFAPDLSLESKLELLETLDVTERLTLALRLQRERLAELQVRKQIRDDVESGAHKQQREYLLRRQMDAIRKELGESDEAVAEEYRKKIADAAMPEAAREQAERELARLERMGESSGSSRCPGRSAPRRSWSPDTPGRSSTPTTPGSTTSSRGSWSTSPSASSERNATSEMPSARGQSSP
jgi:ATP-dependent Lon protease